MNARTIVLLIAAGLCVVWMARCSRDPLRTALPFGTTDLSSVQTQLARLPSEQRRLVEDYVKRSNGDVLPAQFADPDDPLTARSFAEAIELQQRWLLRQDAENVRLAELRAQREIRVQPLRDLVRASVVKASIHNADGRSANSYRSMVLRIRVENLGRDGIVELKGALKAIDRDAYLPLDLCWIDLNPTPPLAAGAHIEFDCGRANQQADAQELAFVAQTPGRFNVEWEPRHIKLQNGRELDSGQ